MPSKTPHTVVLSRLRRICLTFPEVTETIEESGPSRFGSRLSSKPTSFAPLGTSRRLMRLGTAGSVPG